MLKHAMRQPAQAIVWVVVIFPLFLGIAGLSIDAGRILDARREAQNVADGAARVAAMQIDMQELHDTGKVQLIKDQAEKEARRYITSHTPGSGWDPPDVGPIANGRQTVGVQVTVSRHITTSFMRLLSARQEVMVSATARAQPCAGITSGNTPTGGTC